ncbi:MAG: hypothetical protein JNJ83_00935 [Verrucomicrobiaceae bacterium]|nr:hypothetical protein [Verrucomicrobiaceae bacterium]
MSVIDKLEARFGHFAIPGLIRVFALAQLLNWLLIMLVPDYLALLVFDREAILSGEVWRLFSYALLPGSFGIIWVLFGVFFMWMLNDGLEAEWGAFKVNLYILSGLFFSAIGGFLSPIPDHGWILWSSVLFAFASYYPNHEIMLYMIVPLKMKWVAALTAGAMFFQLLGNPELRLAIVFGLINFFIVFLPGFIKNAGRKAATNSRRMKFQAAQLDESEALHTCSVCGKTSNDHPSLGFRVTADGDDICDECRAQKLLSKG